MRNQISYTVDLFTMADKYSDISVTSPEDVPTSLVREMFGPCLYSHEEFHVIYMNNANKIRFTERISSGSSNACIVPLNKIITTMSVQRVNKAIMLHNHPSGYVKFSTSDLNLAKKMKRVFKDLEFVMLDFMLVTDDFKLTSALNRGLI